MENVKRYLDFGYFVSLIGFIVYGSQSFNVFFSESAISKVPPTRTSRRSQSKAKSKPLEPEVDLQLLKTLCNENECNVEEVWAPPSSHTYTHTHTHSPHLFLSYLQSSYRHIFCPLLFLYLAWFVFFCKPYLQVKNVYQTSFSAFLDSLDLSKSPDFPPVGMHTCATCLVSRSALHPLFPFVISYCLLFPYLSVWVSDSCWLFSLLLVHVWLHMHGVRRMCTQAGDSLLCLRVVYCRGRYENQGHMMLLFADMDTLFKEGY